MAHMERLKGDLTSIREYILKNDADYWIGVDGMERSGKSTLAIQMCQHYNPEFSIDDIVFTGKEFRKRVLNSNPGDTILIDEGALILYSLENNTKEVRKIIKMVTTMGQYNLFTVCVVPKITVIVPYVREHRLKGYIHIYKKGTYAVYSKKGLQKYLSVLTARRKRGAFVRNPQYMYRERFGKVDGELWKAYLKKKRQQDRDYMDFDEKKEKDAFSMDNYIQLRKVAHSLDCDRQTLSKVCKENNIFMLKNYAGWYFIKREDYEKLRKVYFNL